jgi:serine protease
VLQQTLDLDLVETWSGSVARYRAPRFDSFAYYYFTGTSMATPHVAGFAALLMQQGITSPAAIEAIMKQFATDLGPPGRDDEFGYGLINPRASLRGMGLAK